jgi:hypothetical protein
MGNRNSLYRCDGCGRSWRKVGSGPMLEDEVWRCIAGQQDILCDGCVRTRIKQVLGRLLQFSDLSCCLYNVYAGYFDELKPPNFDGE